MIAAISLLGHAMIFGMSTLTFVHVLISLIGIVSGLVVLSGLLASNRMKRWTLCFLVTTIATSVTGFLFPFHGFTPAIGLGILSLAALALAVIGRYGFHISGSWRWIYAVAAVVSLYFNVFVLVVQSFQKIPPLHFLAPHGSEPPFMIVQAVVLVFFIVMGFFSVRLFHPRAV
jgi:hypothetical protein